MPTGGQDPASPLAVKQGGLAAAAVPRSGRRALARVRRVAPAESENLVSDQSPTVPFPLTRLLVPASRTGPQVKASASWWRFLAGCSFRSG